MCHPWGSVVVVVVVVVAVVVVVVVDVEAPWAAWEEAQKSDNTLCSIEV